jgi:hypothetical protein
MLARLLATENISVCHENIQTAFFNLRTRSLHLPLWSNTSGALYDMLVGHEVSHALYTPPEGWLAAVASVSAATGCSENTAKQYINIVEDARIERLIQSKFRGLKADFISAYKTLMERKFFGDISNTNSMILADRFNLHFKCGVHAGTVIRFTPEETVFVTRGEGVSTWEEVVRLAQDMIVHAQEVQSRKAAPQTVQEQDSGEGKADGGSTPSGTTETAAAETDSTVGESASSEHATRAQTAAGNSTDDGIAPKTNENLEEALKTFTKPTNGVEEVFRVSTENLSQSVRVVHWSEFLKDMRVFSSMTTHMATPVRIADYTSAAVTMATAFNRRKAADAWRRTSVAKTGSLDTLRMNQYKWNEDIFRRTTRVTDGKNHGIVILLDWSGSMSQIMESTIGQLFILSDFCRKVGVPFEVYAFSNTRYDSGTVDDYERRDLSPVSTASITMFNFLSSRMGTAEYEAAKCCLWNWRYIPDHRYSLNATPTTAALVSACSLVSDFIARTRVQIAHTVVLTDGEPTDDFRLNLDKISTSVGKAYAPYRKTAVVLDDPQTGASYDLRRVRPHYGSEYCRYGSVTVPEGVNHHHSMIAVDMVRRRTGSKVHWIGLAAQRKNGINPQDYGMKCKDNNWKRDGFIRGTVWGWDSAIVVHSDRFLRSSNGEVSKTAQTFLDAAEERMDNAHTKGALAKAFMESQTAHGSLRTVANHIGEYLAV